MRPEGLGKKKEWRELIQRTDGCNAGHSDSCSQICEILEAKLVTPAEGLIVCSCMRQTKVTVTESSFESDFSCFWTPWNGDLD